MIFRWDEEIFLALYRGLNNIPAPYWEFLSSKWTGFFFSLTILCGLSLFFKSKSFFFYFVLKIGFVVGLTDFLTFWVWKEIFQRPRPCVKFEGLLDYVSSCSFSYSFPSNHAANTMALAVLMAQRKLGILGYICLGACLLTSLSRVALGAHYLLDVLGGMVWGGVLPYSWVSFWGRGFSKQRIKKK